MTTRAPAVAGTFYPARPDELRAAIGAATTDAVAAPPDAPVPKILVVPHAGYVYSGPVAASGFALLDPVRDRVERVVLLGPSHRVWFEGMAVSGADAFDTPFGPIPVDDELRERVRTLPGVIVDDRPHRDEHSLEVELPFLQVALDRFTLLPISVGDAPSDAVAAVIDAVWGGPETLIVVSTDLSHYHAYDEARRIDAATCAAIVAAREDRIGDRAACGARPLRGALRVAGRRGLAVRQIDVRTSGDTAGDRHRVVGYGSFAIG